MTSISRVGGYGSSVAKTGAAGRTGRRAGSARVAKWAGADSPWTMQDLLRLTWMSGLGLIGIGVCWYGISGQATMHRQLGWLVGAVAALTVAGIGMVGFLLAGLRAVHAETFEVVTEIRRDRLGEDVDAIDDLAPVVAAPVALASAGYVTGASMTRVHRPDCPHVRGKQVGPISENDIARLGLTKCGVCC